MVVKVIEVHSGEVLFTSTLEEIEEAYAYAVKMEEMGLEVKIDAPSLPETLAKSLGKEDSEIELLKESIEREIMDHDFSSLPCSKDLLH